MRLREPKPPVFENRDGLRAFDQQIAAETENYALDIRRGSISPTMSFAAYVQRYAGWRLVKKGALKR